MQNLGMLMHSSTQQTYSTRKPKLFLFSTLFPYHILANISTRVRRYFQQSAYLPG